MVFSSLAATCCCCAENSPVPDVKIAAASSVFDVPQGQQELTAHHHREADDLRADLEVLERRAFDHRAMLQTALPCSSKVPMTAPTPGYCRDR
jgi:hypothetical protein